MKGKGYKGGGAICKNCVYPECVFRYEHKRKKPLWIQQMRRNDLIVAMRKQKIVKDVARQFGLSVSQINRIVAQHEKICQLCGKEFDRGQLA